MYLLHQRPVLTCRSPGVWSVAHCWPPPLPGVGNSYRGSWDTPALALAPSCCQISQPVDNSHLTTATTSTQPNPHYSYCTCSCRVALQDKSSTYLHLHISLCANPQSHVITLLNEPLHVTATHLSSGFIAPFLGISRGIYRCLLLGAS